MLTFIISVILAIVFVMIRKTTINKKNENAATTMPHVTPTPTMTHITPHVTPTPTMPHVTPTPTMPHITPHVTPTPTMPHVTPTPTMPHVTPTPTPSMPIPGLQEIDAGVRRYMAGGGGWGGNRNCTSAGANCPVRDHEFRLYSKDGYLLNNSRNISYVVEMEAGVRQGNNTHSQDIVNLHAQDGAGESTKWQFERPPPHSAELGNSHVRNGMEIFIRFRGQGSNSKNHRLDVYGHYGQNTGSYTHNEFHVLTDGNDRDSVRVTSEKTSNWKISLEAFKNI